MEETNDAHGYSKLGKSRRRNDFHNSNGFTNISPPADSYNAVYLSFVLGGAGFLLPYNSFIMAMDYFKIRYPDSPVVFDMSLVYIAIAFLTVLGNNLLVETFTLNSRINFGYFMSFITLIFVVVCEVWWEAFGTATSYGVNLAAVAVVAVGCTVQQSSFYGYTSMLPARYTQAVMVGESASGVFTSSVRVLTRFLIPEIRGSTIYFFTVSVSAVATCFAMYHLIRRTDFIQFYIALCERAKTRITLEPTEDAGLIETNDAQYGVLKIQNSPPPTGNTLSFANPAYEPSAPMPVPTYKVEDIVIRGRQSVSTTGGLSGIRTNMTGQRNKNSADKTAPTKIEPFMLVYEFMLALFLSALFWFDAILSAMFLFALLWRRCLVLQPLISVYNFEGGLLARWEITKAIHPYMISICLVYFATLCLYPGIASEIISCRLGSWMPILMMALFNGADLFGKMLASSSRYWTGGRLVRCSVARLIMIPLMIMCVAPRASPIFSAEVTAFTFALILGFSNGILGSVPMIQAPSKVEDRYRELTGNMMTLLYNFGLTTGSLMAYFLESILSPVENHPCSPNPVKTIIEAPANINLTTIIYSTPVTIVTLATTLSTGAENTTNFSR